jgi:hypothetical protein
MAEGWDVRREVAMLVMLSRVRDEPEVNLRAAEELGRVRAECEHVKRGMAPKDAILAQSSRRTRTEKGT